MTLDETKADQTSTEVTVHFSAHLRRFMELPKTCEATGSTVRELILDLERQFPGVTDYILHENGKLRQHVNLFVDQAMVSDRDEQSDSVLKANELFVMQALSGG